jgi:hypothetical protein
VTYVFERKLFSREEGMPPPFKRTRIWVDAPFQFRLLVRLVAYFVLYMFVVFHLGFLWEVVQALGTNGPTPISVQLYGDFLRKQLPMLVGFFVVAPAFLYDLVKFSHRVAGPLFRCRNLMQEMAAGKPVPEFTPRKHDLMKELLEAFSALIRTWNTRVGAGQVDLAPLADKKAVSPSSEMHAGTPAQA